MMRFTWGLITAKHVEIGVLATRRVTSDEAGADISRHFRMLGLNFKGIFISSCSL